MTIRRIHPRDGGMAMLEFVLVLPFVWMILVLALNFATALLERQRMLVATREAGMRHLAALGGGEVSLDAIASALAGDMLAQRQLTASFTTSGGFAECPAAGGSVDASRIRGAFIESDSVMNRLSSSHVYAATGSGRRLVGRWLSQPRYVSCFAVDASPWTYRETQGYTGMVERFLPRTF
jgi:hypothetical protein